VSAKGRKPRGTDRFAFLLAVMVVLLTVVGARLAWIQVFEARAYAQIAEKQRVREMVLSPKRGAIFDREGERLAITVDAKTIYAVPFQVKDKPGTARTLAKILGGKPEEYEKKLSRSGAFVYLGRKVEMERASALEKLGIAGIGFLDDSRRSYPSGELACQILGFVGVDDDGLSGLEAYYDKVLAGKPGRVLAEKDASGRYIPPGGLMSYEDPIDGRNITLTIDKDIQYQAQVELAATVKKYAAKGGSVVILDPRTGEIYAMASTPTFNPNFYGEAKADAFRNKPISDGYEPGSTIKSFTAAAVIDLGMFTPESKFSLPPTIRVGGRTIHESHGRGAVTWPLSQIVTKSSNVGAVKLGLALGKNRLYRYFKAFGLTEKTGVDFPGEFGGTLPPPKLWSASSIGNIPFGQGLAVTPLQLARGLSALANRGAMITPHFLLKESGAATEPVWPQERVVTSQTASTMTEVLAEVVKDGTGSAAKVSGYDVAGKTGTAQKAGRGGYAAGRFVGSFAGYLPAGDPRVLIVVTLDEPRNGYYGGTVAAPTFATLAKFCVAHLQIPPSASAKKPKSPAKKARKAAASTGSQASEGAGNGRVSKGRKSSGSTPTPVLESDDPDR
jgi:cell division protein FtsI/penicillin-binding protein 2